MLLNHAGLLAAGRKPSRSGEPQDQTVEEVVDRPAIKSFVRRILKESGFRGSRHDLNLEFIGKELT